MFMVTWCDYQHYRQQEVQIMNANNRQMGVGLVIGGAIGGPLIVAGVLWFIKIDSAQSDIKIQAEMDRRSQIQACIDGARTDGARSATEQEARYEECEALKDHLLSYHDCRASVRAAKQAIRDHTGEVIAECQQNGLATP